jgi:hypothetical protein
MVVASICAHPRNQLRRVTAINELQRMKSSGAGGRRTRTPWPHHTMQTPNGDVRATLIVLNLTFT